MVRGASHGAPAFLEPTEFFQVGQEEPGLRLYLRYDLFRVLDEFAARDSKKELAALLVGQVLEADEGLFLLVEDAIEVAVGDEESGGRFGHRTWQHARRIAQAKHQDKTIVGWFHTHSGTGLEPTTEEREAHGRYFPEPWQMLYVVDAVQKDRNFFRPHEGRLGGLRGFRIFGKDSAPERKGVLNQEIAMEKERPRPAQEAVRAVSKTEEQLRERYLERTLEKIQKQLRRPAMRPIDGLIVVLLLANLGYLVMRPAPVARVDTSSMADGQKKLTDQVKAMNSRLEKLEQHLAAMRVIDEQLSITPSSSPTPKASESPKPTGSTTPTPAATTTTTPSASPTASSNSAPEPGSDEVKNYKVAPGDTLSILCERFYGSSSAHILKGLAHFNKLKAMELFPGDTLKIPAKDKLH